MKLRKKQATYLRESAPVARAVLAVAAETDAIEAASIISYLFTI